MPALSSMLPTAGLFLPETLHRSDLPSPASPEADGTRLKYFQRKYGRPKNEPRDSTDRPSTAIPREPCDDVSLNFQSIPTTYYFADYVSSSEKASPDTLAFANEVQEVRQHIEKTTRLQLSSGVKNFLDAYPNKRTWVETTLLDVRRALNEIGADMDAVWNHDDDGGTVASKQKLMWALKNQKRLLKRRESLKSCHGELKKAICVMETAELCSKPGAIVQDPIFEAPVRPWVPVDEKDALRGPYSRQKYRVNHTNLSASNVTISSEAEKDDVDASSVNSVPVELAGSTPADLDLTESHDMHTLLRPQVSREFLSEGTTLLRRPRARSDHMRPAASREIRTRASIDITGPRSQRFDTTMERNDSTLSTIATVGVPMVARRYRATSVDIQRHTERHRSLPSELPHLKSQPSLIDDLAEYVLLSAASEVVPRRAWATSPTLSVPSISVTSSPTTAHALPAVSETPSMADEPQASGESAALPQTQHSARTISPTNSQEDPASRRGSIQSSTHKLHSPSSLSNISASIFTDDEPVRRPSSQRPSQRMAKRASHASSSKSYIAALSPIIATIVEPPSASDCEKEVVDQDAIPTPHTITNEASQLNPSHCEKELVTPDAVPAAAPPTPITNEASPPIPAHAPKTPEEPNNDPDDIILSVLKERLRSQTDIRKMAEDLVRAKSEQGTTTSSTPESTQTTSAQEESASTPVQCQTPSNHSQTSLGSKPMSAQAKRRAAHARRMQLAFGDGAAG
ncbi:hypothetical protein BDW02DRAFT_555337 [Decorospora gaudefroyi]|uniref:Uncharacterized protein n=1 Tax=Decorospora gaudefroyi TaxID=184978 RepID=A0A6A5KBD0_9PLEO|nr:hypothetical protein BDW02DRAFT_555337 [Decorospora gaudefroyi]